MDICISFDTTGSMYSIINEVKKNIIELTRKLFAEIKNLRISIVTHGDYCDEHRYYLMKSLDFANDPDTVINFVKNSTNTGGCGPQAAYEYVLSRIQDLTWTYNNRAFVMIGDVVPNKPNRNPYNLDWTVELEKVKNMGINIYSVQALYSGNKQFYNFYNTLAKVTNGYHLFLDQFSYISMILTAICYKQEKEDGFERLKGYEEELNTKGYKKNRSMQVFFNTIMERQNGNGNNNGNDGNDGDIVPCPAAKYQVMNVDEDIAIKNYVQKNGLTFKTGKGFYEFTKPEIISWSKDIVLMKRDTGDLFEGDGARQIIGLNNNSPSNKKHKPTDLPDYRVFIQSTSHNRKLIKGTGFLYEAEDWLNP